MADYYTLLTNAGIAYETACKAAGLPIKLSQLSVGDGGGAVYNPAATDIALKREVWRGPLNALFQDEKNPSWLLAEVTIPPDVGGWYVREAGIWTDTGILYAIVKYPESFKPVLANSGSGKEFYLRSIFETSNAALVTLMIDDTVVKATRAWVTSYVADELAKLDSKQSVRVATIANIALAGPQTIDGVAVVAGDRVLVKNQTVVKDNGLYIAAVADWVRAKDADASTEVTSGLIVSVEQGATLADTRWQLVTDGAIVLGTTALTFQNVTQGFAPLNSPALISPTANAPARFDNTKKLATTEWIKARGVELGGFYSFVAPLTGIAAHVGSLVHCYGSGPVSYSIPDSVANGIQAGATIRLQNWSIATLILSTQGADKMQESLSIPPSAASRSVPPDTYLDMIFVGDGAWVLLGTGVVGKTAPFGALMSANGYQKLPSGLIIQWMTALFSSAALSTPFNLPIAFPSKNFGCNVSMTDSTIYGSTGSPFVAGMANGLGQVVVQSNYTASQSAVRVLAFGM
ncbi:MAG: phage tail protein [Pseudomonas sp.]|uniref:phage tail protein n=1 Tax=Pseudomonas TaxID=286 RepID=UPI001C829D82|nr:MULTISPECIES: phage tail protein [Pseudomonas]MDO8712084.1 phage tail protein [Pseudomonas sp.]MDO9330555.1 phage tail protein [Pseudomonas sp.]QZA99349.1 phage tail protein [Pseudomonas mandelii]